MLKNLLYYHPKNADILLLSEAEQELYAEKCVCIACVRRLSCADVTEFDNYTAICPECGEKAIIPDIDNDISEVFLHALNEYWFPQ